MKTQAELRAEFHRLFEADLLEEADRLLDQLDPLNEEEWRKMLESAPIDHEPVSESERSGFAEIRRVIEAEGRQQAG